MRPTLLMMSTVLVLMSANAWPDGVSNRPMEANSQPLLNQTPPTRPEEVPFPALPGGEVPFPQAYPLSPPMETLIAIDRLAFELPGTWDVQASPSDGSVIATDLPLNRVQIRVWPTSSGSPLSLSGWLQSAMGHAEVGHTLLRIGYDHVREGLTRSGVAYATQVLTVQDAEGRTLFVHYVAFDTGGGYQMIALTCDTPTDYATSIGMVADALENVRPIGPSRISTGRAVE